jgi:dGTPase
MTLYPEGHAERVVRIPPSPDEPYRTPWRRDYARLIHSAAFRRLQGKTQLFPGNESDFFRNRLTHSLEVAQIAKSIAIRINNTYDYFKSDNINTDLVETAALGHDLGHPPFGHNGEEALDRCMRRDGGFEGNAQSLRILSKLEKRQTRTTSSEGDTPIPVLDGKDNRAGLNLTYRTLAAVLKYDNEIPTPREKVAKGYYYTERDLVQIIRQALGARP